MLLALKAFFKAFKDPKGAKYFLEGAKDEKKDSSQLKLLYLLQKQGRLIDFLKEDISGFTDEQVGAAVRQVHNACEKSLEQWLSIRPYFDQLEGEEVSLSEDYDRQSVKVVGNVRGKPPYKGVIRHRGWRASKHALPKEIHERDQTLICPAEVEVV